MTDEPNPFATLAATPPGGSPEAQLIYLKQVVEAFASTGNPRIRPLGQQLDAALARLAQGSARGADVESLARTFAAEIHELRYQAYDLLLTIINQVRGTVRLRLKSGMPAPERVDTEALAQALGHFAQGLRKALSAARKGDERALGEAEKMVSEAGALLEKSGHELTQ